MISANKASREKALSLLANNTWPTTVAKDVQTTLSQMTKDYNVDENNLMVTSWAAWNGGYSSSDGTATRVRLALGLSPDFNKDCSE